MLSTIARTNSYMGMNRGMRVTVTVSSISFWNPNFSNMVATGNRPPYAVRFLPWKSYRVDELILYGFRDSSCEACGTGFLRICLQLIVTIWVTSRNGLVKLRTSRPSCSTTAFLGSPNGFSYLHHFKTPHLSRSLCI